MTAKEAKPAPPQIGFTSAPKLKFEIESVVRVQVGAGCLAFWKYSFWLPDMLWLVS